LKTDYQKRKPRGGSGISKDPQKRSPVSIGDVRESDI